MVLDRGTFREWNADLPICDPLEFPGYKLKLEHAREVTNLDEAVITGEGQINGTGVAIGVMSSNFMMGSMGSVVGEKITRTFEAAQKNHIPVIGITASGGARMQEGITSLMQMAKCSGAIKNFSNAGGLYVTVLSDPTTGGVTASFAMQGDIIISEPGALIGFAGPRVIEQTIRQKLPTGFQRAEFLLEKGFLDAIVRCKEQKAYITKLLYLHQKGGK
jgi:acetyl-CoA carboxylase carboxyl transferase subunit beta